MRDHSIELLRNGFDISYRRISVGPLNREIFNKLQYQVHWDKSEPFSALFDTPEKALEVFIEKVKELKREKV